MNSETGRLRALAGAAVAGQRQESSGDSVMDPHGALRPLQDAARLAGARIVVLRVPIDCPSRPSVAPILETALKGLAYSAAHLRLVGRVWRSRSQDLVVVREFLTAFLTIVWPLVWPLRSRVCFVVNHNLQQAHRRGFDRRLLRFLCRSGARLVCFESAAGFDEIGISLQPGGILIMPHPISAVVPPHRRPAADVAVVGVIGSVRAEKAIEDVLHKLIELRREGRLRARLVLGCPEARFRAEWLEEGLDVIDTTTHQAYVEALDLCDVVVLNYRRERYYYRPSGVAADAIARGAAVVCPDFPLLRQQLTVPARVGTVFRDLDDVGRAVAEAIALRAAECDSWEAHERARGAAVLAGLLDDFATSSRREPGGLCHRGGGGARARMP